MVFLVLVQNIPFVIYMEDDPKLYTPFLMRLHWTTTVKVPPQHCHSVESVP